MRTLAVDREGRVVRLHVAEPVPPDRAETLAWEIEDACRQIDESDELAVCAALSGGGDTFLLASADRSEAGTFSTAAASIARSLGRLGVPTLAILAGDAIGPSWEIALACDLRLAANDVLLGSPDLSQGRMPSAGATQRLPRIVGLGTALRLLLLGQVLSGQDAQTLGLLHEAVPAAELDAAAERLLSRLEGAAPVALAFVKEAVGHALDLPLDAGLRLEADLAALLQTTFDRAEGLRSYGDRRQARFEGR